MHMNFTGLRIIILFFFILLILFEDKTMASTGKVYALLDDAIGQFRNISDYTCILEKKVNKAGVVYYDPEIYMKYRKPAQYYFKWKTGRFKGQEVIYVEGKNNDRIVAHSGGFLSFITLYLDPEGRIAMKRDHHSLKRSGLEKINDIISKSLDHHKQSGLGQIELKGEGMFDNKEVWLVEGDFPEDEGFYASKIVIFLSKESKLPLKVTVHDWAGALFEEYAFYNLKLDMGLEEKEFATDNSDYNFN